MLKKIILSVLLLAAVYLYSLYYEHSISAYKERETTKINPSDDNVPKAPNSRTLLLTFEEGSNDGSLSEGNAHSGKFAAKVFGKNSFSRGIEKKISELPFSFRKISLGAWVNIVKRKEAVNLHYVFNLLNGKNESLIWQSAQISGDSLPENRWFPVSFQVDLKELELRPDYYFKIYFWNNSDCDALVDDFKIVFEAVDEKRGSLLWDFNRDSAKIAQRVNLPPFPVLNLMQKCVSKSLLSNVDINARFFPFYLNNSGKSHLLTVYPDGNFSIFEYTSDFVKVAHKGKDKFSSNSLIVCKDIDGDKNDELVEADKEKKIIRIWDITLKDAVLNFSVLGEISQPLTSDAAYLLADDFNNDSKSEILLVFNNGAYSVFAFADNKIQELTRQAKIDEWNTKKFKLSLIAGNFFSAQSKELLASYSDAKENQYCFYYWNSTKKLFEKKKNISARQSGLDSLKGSDLYFVLKDNSGKDRLIRYNRDWRFDLKLYGFSQEGYTIIGNVDFKGYPADKNPKYYEKLKIVPGNFLSAQQTDFLVIGSECSASFSNPFDHCNEENNPLLPKFFSIYLPEKDF